MKKGILLLALALSPTLVFAAGFAKQSLFLSRSSVTEGDTVLVHAVVSNETPVKFSGTLTFKDASSTIGSLPVSLAADEGSVISSSWKPAAGSHAVVAELKDSGGAVVETQKATFVIAAKPAPSPAVTGTSGNSAAAIESSAGIQQNIAQIAPPVETYVKPVFTAIDSARSAAADVLDGQLASTKTKLGPDAGDPGAVLGAEATKNAAKDPWSAFLFMLQTLYFYLLTLVRFVIGSAAIFYPILMLLFLYLIWRGFRRFRRPAY